MIPYALVFLGLVAVPPEGSSPLSVADQNVYEAARARAGRDTQAHVKLAIWCEARGLNAERLKHLALAVLTDPKNVTARGLLGLVSHEGRWSTPDEVSERLKSDDSRAARLSEYNRRRAELEEQLDRHGRGRRLSRSETALAHVKLAMWCEQAGLKEEATAHFTSAVVLDPYRETTWKHLGYVKHNGRWMSHEQIAVEQEEALAQQKGNQTWLPLLTKWRGWLGDKDRRAEAEELLAKVDDPRSVPAIIRVFGDESEAAQMVEARLLRQIDAPASTRELAWLAVFGSSAPVRTVATDALKGRSPSEFLGTLVDLIKSPMKYRIEPVGGPGSPGALLVETPRFRMLRTYDAPPAFQLSSQFFGYVGYDTNGLPVVARGVELKRMGSPKEVLKIEARTAELIAEAQVKAAVSQQRLIADVNDIESSNAQTNMVNGRVVPVLMATLNAPDLNDDEDAWQTWRYDQAGYRYEPPPQMTLAVNASPMYPPPRIASCFVAGTLVRTAEGHRPIEKLVAGDRVLSQDVATGELSFQTIRVVHHNPPARTLKVELDNGETLVASIYHRFWKAGKGWAMARELKAGDTLRTLAGLARVVSVTDGEVKPLFNLDVAKTRSFFVGQHDTLVHDNTMPDPRTKPFDAEPDLVAAIKPID